MSVPLAYIVSAHPERLHRFREIGARVAYALRVRSYRLDNAVYFHELRTEPAYEVAVSDLGPAVIALADVLEDLGAWVGRVGDGFLAADADNGDGVIAIPEGTFDRLFAALPAGPGPGRSLLGPGPPVDGPLPPGEQPAPAGGLLDHVDTAADTAGVIDDAIRVAQGGGQGAVAAERGGAVAALLASQRFGSFVRWFAPVGTVADAGGAALDRWVDDQPLDLTTGDRVSRAATEATIVTGFGVALAALFGGLGRAAGAAVGSAGGPVGAAGGYVGGGYAGTRVGGAVADAVLDDEPDPPAPIMVAADVGEVDPVLVDDVLDSIDDEAGVGASPLGAALAAGEIAWADPGAAGAVYDEAAQLATLGEPPGPRAEPADQYPRLYSPPTDD